MISFKRLLIAGLVLSCTTFSMNAMQDPFIQQAQQKIAALLSAAKLKAKYAKSRAQYANATILQQPNANNLSRRDAFTILSPFTGFLNSTHKQELVIFLRFPPEGIFTHENIYEFLKQFPDVIDAFKEDDFLRLTSQGIIEQAQHGVEIAQAQLDLIRNVTRELKEHQNNRENVNLMVEELEKEEKKDTEIKREFFKFQTLIHTMLKQVGINVNPNILISFINYLLDKGFFGNITAIRDARNLTNQESEFIRNEFTLFSQNKKNNAHNQEEIEEE